MRNFYLNRLKAAGLVMAMFFCRSVTAESFTGTWKLKALDFETGAESAYGNTYLNDVTITIAPAAASQQANWDLVVTNLCGQGTTYGGKLSDNGSTLTLTMVGNAYFSDRDYFGKGTESLGSPEGTIAGTIEFTMNEDGSLAVSDYTVINTIIGDAPVSTVLATYKNNVATAVKEYYFSSGEDDFSTVTGTGEGEASPHGIVYTRHWGFSVHEYRGNGNYQVEVDGLGGIATCKAYGLLAADGTITLSGLGYAYLSAYEGYGGKGTESLGSPEGTIAGNITLTPDAEGGYTVSDFTAINTTIGENGLANDILAAWKNGKATPAQKYHFNGTFTKGEDSPHGVIYPETFDFTVRRCIENSNYAAVVTGLCGREGVKSYGADDNGNITLKMLSGTYLTPYEGYSGIGTECLGNAEGVAMGGSIELTAQADGSLAVSDFTAVNMYIDGMPKTTILAKWEGGIGTPIGNTDRVGTTSVGQTKADARTQLTVKEGSIVFGAQVACRVYAADGTLVYSGTTGRVSGLKPGLYIVTANGGSAVKVLLK